MFSNNVDLLKIEYLNNELEELFSSLENITESISDLNKDNLSLEEFEKLVFNLGHRYDDISIEELDGERKSILEKVNKGITNVLGRISELTDELTFLTKEINSKNINDLMLIKEDIVSGKLTLKDKQSISSFSSKKLGIFRCMGGDLNGFDKLIKHLRLPTDLMRTSNFYMESIDYVSNYLTSLTNHYISEFKENDLTKKSLDILDRIEDKKIRSWLKKDTVLGIMDRFLDDRLFIQTLSNTGKFKRKDDRHDFFLVDKKYIKNDINITSNEDAIKLIDFVIDYKERENIILENVERIKSNNIWFILKKTDQTLVELAGATLVLFAGFTVPALYMTAPHLYRIAVLKWGILFNTALVIKKTSVRINKDFVETPLIVLDIINSIYERK